MQRLIVVRHGQSGAKGLLTTVSLQKMQALGEKLSERVQSERVLILSSSAPPVRRSVSVIVGELVADPAMEEHDALASDEKRPPNYDGVLRLLDEREESYDVIVLVTHAEYAEHFPTYYAHQRLQRSITCGSLDPCRAWVLDLERHAIELL